MHYVLLTYFIPPSLKAVFEVRVYLARRAFQKQAEARKSVKKSQKDADEMKDLSRVPQRQRCRESLKSFELVLCLFICLSVICFKIKKTRVERNAPFKATEVRHTDLK